MIFASEAVPLVLQGRKTQLRRHAIGPCPVQPGRDYAVQTAPGRRQIARVTVQSVRRGRLGDVSASDARREGFPTVAAFMEWWVDEHDERWQPRLIVWIIDFRLFTRQRPRLLARGPGSDGRGYTDRPAHALAEEPEAVEDDVLDRFAVVAHQRDEERRRAMPLSQRMASTMARARAAGVDVSKDARVIERRLSVIERRVNGS